MTLADRVPPEFWTVLDKLQQINRLASLGFPNVADLLIQIAKFDVTYFRTLGNEVWGTGGDSLGMPGELAKDVREDLLLTTVKLGERWAGEGYSEFANATETIRDLLEKMTATSQEMGKLLVGLADEMELTWDELTGIVLTAAGVVITLVTGITGLGAIIGAIITAAGVVLTLVQTFGMRAWEVYQTSESLKKEIAGRFPGHDFSAILPAPEIEDWTARTADPTN